VRSWSIDAYLGRLAARHPTPAGAAVAALNLAQAAALLAMVARFRDDPDHPGRDVAQSVLARAEDAWEAALRLAEADAAAVDEVAAAYALPRSTEAERGRRTAAIADALLAAARPPAELVPVGAELVGLCERMAEVGSGALLADVAAAADAVAAGLSISRTNVEADIAPRRGVAEAERLAAAVGCVDDLLRRAGQVREKIRGSATHPSGRTQRGDDQASSPSTWNARA
jgi:methenyltetrahydrofolate cyclohydrolase